MQGLAPEYVRRLAPAETFRFSCHPGVACFTDCCRELELALTPYDVLRLRRGLSLSSAELLERYLVVETAPEDLFPRVYLGMVDDGRASCPFVSPAGCGIYGDRPGACRTYPLGRGARRDCTGEIRELYVLLTEPHCRGFAQDREHTATSWIEDQELTMYNQWNDKVMALLQHRRLRQGFRPDDRQQELYLLALYDVDTFRSRLAAGDLASGADLPSQDEPLLQFGLDWLKRQLFGC